MGQFNTTHWSLVLRAGNSSASHAEAALEELCRIYWYPLYAYVRRGGHSRHDAQDLTQEFFARLLQKKHLNLVSQERGRFRSFLLKSLQHFLVNEWARGQAQKRGGGQKHFSLDDEEGERLYLQEPSNDAPLESFFDKRWAVTLLDRAMHQLRLDYVAAGKGNLFERLKSVLLSEGSTEVYRELAADLQMTESATKVAAHRLRQRFRLAVRAEIAQTVSDPAAVDEELRALISALSS